MLYSVAMGVASSVYVCDWNHSHIPQNPPPPIVIVAGSGLGWYLAIDARRDVIECPIEDDLDINGWDIRKALQLLLKANPVLFEWLVSPVRYQEDAMVVAALRDLAARAAFHRPARHHYLRLGSSQYEREIAGRSTMRLKRYFYALRPALAL